MLRGDGELECEPEAATLAVDVSMLNIVLVEALSNARKYRQPTSRIHVSAVLRHVTEGSGAAGHVLALTVTNQNCDGAGKLDDEQCKRAFSEGYRTHQTSAATVSSSAELSSGI
eukprot:6858196-Prymnesium_polylepis.1